MFKKMLAGLGLGLCLILSTLFASAQSDVGGRVVFISTRSGAENLWIHDLKLGTTIALTDFPADGDFRRLIYPRWSPDGRKISFGGYGAGGANDFEIYTIDVATKEIVKITDCPGSEQSYISGWDPNDPNILFYIKAYPASTAYVYRKDLQTGVEQFIPNSDGLTTQMFVVTNDSAHILFSRERQCCWGYNMYSGYQDFFGGNEVQILPTDGIPENVWNINRTDEWILLSQYTGGPNDIYKMDRNGGQMIRLTWGANSCGPVWTNGDNNGYIIFQTYYFGQSEIVLMKADGTDFPQGMINLSNDSSEDFDPDWTPFESPRVRYAFEGFFSPIENPPAVNKANAGQAIPVKWRITDKDGNAISDPASFVSIKSYAVNCATFEGDPVNGVDESAAGSSGLQYLGDGWWQFNWKTIKTYKGQCRTMVFTLDDQSEHTAKFSFK